VLKKPPQGQFIEGIRGELKKVTWPSRAETIRLTIVVVVVSLIVALYVGIIDTFLAKGLAFIGKFR